MPFPKRALWTRVFLCGTVLLAGQPVLAQDKKPIGVYVTLAAGGGTHTFGRAAVDVMQDRKWSLGFTYGLTNGRSPNEPFDYDSYSNHGFFSSGPNKVYDRGAFGALAIGRAVLVSDKFRWHNRAGLSLNQIESSENFQLVDNPHKSTGFLSFGGPPEIYAFDKVNRRPVGLYLSSSLEFAPPGFFGFTLGLLANIHSEQSLVGIDIGILMGRAGKKRESKMLRYDPNYKMPKGLE